MTCGEGIEAADGESLDAKLFRESAQKDGDLADSRPSGLPITQIGSCNIMKCGDSKLPQG